MSEKPLAYVLGVAPFMGREFLAEPGTIYPREESAIVVKTIIALAEAGAISAPPGEPLRIIDMCGGSGNLGCVLALSIPGARVWTADLLACSSALAQRNVAKHGLADRVEVVNGDLFHSLEGRGLEQKVDAIACSPPFISTGRLTRDRAYLLEHEPREAFDAGPYGISIHMRLAKEAPAMLRPGGYLVCEFGEGQAKQVESLVTRTRAYEDIRILSDDDGVPRAVCARKAVVAPAAA
jgi:release factor glutamine methyltransferase